MISRFHIFAPGTAGMVEQARLAPRPRGIRVRGFTPSTVRRMFLRCGSLAEHADLAGSPGGYGFPIPTVAGCGGNSICR